MTLTAFTRFTLVLLMSLGSIGPNVLSDSVQLKTEVLGDVVSDSQFSEHSSKSPYWIIIDGGSTGSRLHIFEFVKKSNNKLECVRRGTTRVDKPLSAFARTPLQIQQNTQLDSSHVAEHLLPLFDFAASAIPSRYHSTTEVRYEATAGMRLLNEFEQNIVYAALYKGLMGSMNFPFTSMIPRNVGTLSGELEGFYGAVAANYLHGSIDASLKLQETEFDDESELPLGALDMGGSSTQLVFLPEQTKKLEPTSDSITSLNGDDFFSTSYLSYGVNEVRERLWNVWIQDMTVDRGDKIIDGKNKIISNPCSFKGHTIEYKEYTLQGTGDVYECTKQLNRLIPSLEKILSYDKNNDYEALGTKVGDVYHPPIRGKFFAMSLYFFALDSLRVLSLPNEALHRTWPNPTIEELSDALHGFCGRSWYGDLEEIRHSAHKYTHPDNLQHRCLEAVYIVTLLRDGFGFDPISRDITFAFDIDGSEVEWTLGMALSLNSNKERVANTNSQSARRWSSNTTNNGNTELEEGEFKYHDLGTQSTTMLQQTIS